MRRALLVLALVACGSDPKPAATPTAAPRAEPALPQSPAGIDRAVIEKETLLLEDIATRGCACTDEPCLRAVDDDLSAYIRVGTMNDVLTDVETWPEDLDQRGQAALMRYYECVVARKIQPHSLGAIALRMFSALRDKACSCRADGTCRKIMPKLDELADQYNMPLTPEQTEEAKTIGMKIGECVRDGMADEAQQGLLEAKRLRERACACHDSDCADRVAADAAAWVSEHESTRAGPGTIEELTEVFEAVRACLDTARAAK